MAYNETPMKGKSMKTPFRKEQNLDKQAEALAKKEKRIARIAKTEKFVDNHPYVSTATVLAITHVVAYGTLALVTRP